MGDFGSRIGSLQQLFSPSPPEHAISASFPRLARTLSSSGRDSSESLSRSKQQQSRKQQSDNGRNQISKFAPATMIKPDWRLRDKMKTVGVGLVLALNIGTDPPDILKPHPCAVLQCWVNPLSGSRTKARELIGDRLEEQYAKWQLPRGSNNNSSNSRSQRNRRAMDPTVEDVRNLCLQLRRQARSERVLLHYNGHGVPKPTDHGEIWVFDKNHTEYIPLPVTDMRQWIGRPSVMVLDCSSAGVLLPYLVQSITGEENYKGSASSMSTERMEDRANMWVRDTIVLCPCDAGEVLPMDPDYPADIFTSCLTTPIRMALRWFIRRNPMCGLDPEAIEIPGKEGDRKTPLGELNWIFTAVTDSIAWNVLPKYLFQRLFRQDLLVASLFRNFLLADRVLRHLGCTPVTYPPLPPTVDHPLWQSWDLAVETMLFQLVNDGILEAKQAKSEALPDNHASAVSTIGPKNSENSSPYTGSSPFFSEQLTAFEVWLDFSSIHKINLEAGTLSTSPEQLPVVLQVLLSQTHRVRALELLRRFLDLGPWAVNLSLSLGIFPYVLKLLQSPEYKSLLVNIWALILAFDPSCRVDLLKGHAFHHFVQHLSYGLQGTPQIDQANAARERAQAAFVLASACYDYPAGQSECVRLNLHGICAKLLASYEAGEKIDVKEAGEDYEQRFPPYFRLWLVMCLAGMSKGNPPIQAEILSTSANIRIAHRLMDKDVNVRAAACYALGCLDGKAKSTSRTPSQQNLVSMTTTTPPPPKHAPQPGIVTLDPLPGIMLPQAASSVQEHPIGTKAPSLVAAPLGHLQEQLGTNPPTAEDLWSPQQAIRRAAQSPNYHTTKVVPSQQPPLVPGKNIVPPQTGEAFIASLLDPNPFKSEDLHRLELDIFSVRELIKSSHDACVLVRHEAVLGLAATVEKYLDTFLAIAEDGPAAGSTDSDSQQVEMCRSVWDRLHVIQKKDCFPSIAQVATGILSYVNEHLLLLTTGGDFDTRRIVEESGNVEPGSDSDLVSLGKPPKALHGARRVQSELLVGTVSSSMERGENIDTPSVTHELPRSIFFQWKAGVFDHQFNPSVDEDVCLDPLSPQGASRISLNRRDYLIREHGQHLEDRYACLAPKAPKPKRRGIELILADSDEAGAQAAEDESSMRKQELVFEEKLVLRNHGTRSTSILCFHPFEEYLVSCDSETSTIALWDTKSGQRNAFFSNGNSFGTKVTASCWVNEQSNNLYLVGTDDGVIRLWSGLFPNRDVGPGEVDQILVSSFHALPMVDEERPSGLLCEWQSINGRLIAAGSSRHLRAWDVEYEQLGMDVKTNSSSHVTSLTTAWGKYSTDIAFGASGVGPDVVVAGLSDGSLRIFDIRTSKFVTDIGRPKRRSTQFSEHRNWIVATAFTDYNGKYEIISGTTAGDVKAWDLRTSSSIRTVEAQRSKMTALATHPKIPLVATGSTGQFVKIMTLDGDTLQVIRNHQKRSNQRIGMVNCVAFHPFKALMATGAADSVVGLFGLSESGLVVSNP